MTNLSNDFSIAYEPYKALLIYRGVQTSPDESAVLEQPVYIESYDIGKNGKPLNAHPLSLSESISLAESLQSGAEMQNGFLRSKGLLPANLLYLDPGKKGYAIWYTPPQVQELFFTPETGIPCGRAWLPGMVWRADRERLRLFALSGSRKPGLTTRLCHAPFLNAYEDNSICMGNVRLDIGRQTGLEDFISLWQQYFFQSYFSHSIGPVCKIKGDMTAFWKAQIRDMKPFPPGVLIPSGKTLTDLIQ